MPPKPFNPPRPRTSTSSANDSTKSRGRPKGSTSKTDSATKSKSISNVAKPTKEQKKLANARFSASGLPSLSPETRRELEGSSDEYGEEEEEEGSDIEMLDGEEGDDDPFASQPLKSKSKSRTSTAYKARKPDVVELGSDGEIDLDRDDGEGDERKRKEKIPEDLLNVILHQFFKQEGTRMHKDANRAVGRYMEVFVREGIARAVWGREEGGNEGGLEVEDLEKLAPQLILDF
ncbi:hypothetical protein BDZ45DRAFT_499233 [Acephala macrosclerotiorum]|nr:hypothetical protein BDZ45DRAFT_499233 [Acephala macrosclerotiorum]